MQLRYGELIVGCSHSLEVIVSKSDPNLRQLPTDRSVIVREIGG